MPLYMDIHRVDSDNFSVEDVVKAHMQDLEVESKFGVKQIKYWVNEENKTIFCLMQGPDKGACVAVHEASHGQTACNIVEVSDDEYNLFLNMGTHKNDLAHHTNGEIDLGNRFLFQLECFIGNSILEKVGVKWKEIVTAHQGSISNHSRNSSLSCFDTIEDALNSFSELKHSLKNFNADIPYAATLIAGEILQEDTSSVFEDVKQKIDIISNSAPLNCLNVDNFTNYLMLQAELSNADELNINVVTTKHFDTFQRIAVIPARNFFEPQFNSNQLNESIGLSRAQTYRIIKNSTGYSPSNFIKTMRLKAACSSLLHEDKSVSEIAYKYGFSSPAYFSKSFKALFHNAPSEIAN